MLNGIKDFIGTFLLKRELKTVNHTRKINKFKFENAKTVGIIFDATNPDDFEQVKRYANELRENNKKVKVLARKSALSDKAIQGKVVVIEDFSFDKPKTKSFTEVIKNLKLGGKKTLLVTADYDKNLYLSGRNVPKANLVHAQDINTYSILNSNVLVLVESAIAKLNETLSK